MTEDQNALLVFGEELAEVASELSQMSVDLLKLQNQVSKAIRFGVDEQRDLPTSNRERIEAEWNDLLGSLVKLSRLGINLTPDVSAIERKVAKIDKYEQYSKDLGEVVSGSSKQSKALAPGELHDCKLCQTPAKLFGGPMAQEGYAIWCSNSHTMKGGMLTADKDKLIREWNILHG